MEKIKFQAILGSSFKEINPAMPKKELTPDLLEAYRYTCKVFQNDIDKLEKKLKNANRELTDYQVKLVAKVTGEDPEDIKIGSWDCPTSPINVCAYGEDGEDSCLFCGGPDERK